MSRIKGGELGTINMPIFLTDEEVNQIITAYSDSPPFSQVYPCELDPNVKVRLLVPPHPDLKQRVLRAELIYFEEVRDFSCLNSGFEAPHLILSVPNEVRVMVHLDLSLSSFAIEPPILRPPNFN